MSKAKTKAAHVATAPTPTPYYPLHMVQRLDANGVPIPRAFDPCGTFGAMVLMEQTNREPNGNRLFCLRCLTDVAATAEEHAQAFAAAHAEGWRAPPPRTLPTTPGDLSEETRRQLRGLLRLEKMPPLPPGPPRDIRVVNWNKDLKLATELADTNGATGWGMGYVEGVGRGTLSATGREMALRIESPEVPAGVARFANDAGYLKAYAKRAKEKKPRAPKPVEASAPMVCQCGDPVASHTSDDPAVTSSRCRSRGCDCKRYRQVKPAKAEKVKRTKAKATA